MHYGIVAEEVAAVAPHLVNFDTEGRPDSVQYRLLTPLLLNEVQQHERRAREQQQTIEALLESNEVLAARLDALESRSLATR